MMSNTNKHRDRNKQIVPIVAIALSAVVLLTGIILIVSSGTKAKYKETVHAGDVAVTVNANLASLLEVKEHQAVRGDTGEYSLSSGTEVTSNSYVLMPGVDIPKDPFVRVTGKTEIPAFLYIEIVDGTVWSTANQRFEYKIGDTLVYSYSIDTANWKRIEQYSDRKIFVYAPGGTETPVTDADDLSHINILAPVSQANAATIVVSSGFDPETVSAGIQMQILPSMAQSADSNTAYEIFRTQLA
jgi:hypothetical protein